MIVSDEYLIDAIQCFLKNPTGKNRNNMAKLARLDYFGNKIDHNESKETRTLSDLLKLDMDMLHQIFSNMTAKDTVSVQPMNEDIREVFAIRDMTHEGKKKKTNG